VLPLLMARLAVERAELRQVDAKLRLMGAAVEETDQLILIVSDKFRVRHTNCAFSAAVGYTPVELMDQPPNLLLADESLPRIDEVRKVKRGYGWSGTLVHKRKDGTTFQAAATIVPLTNEGGDITHYVWMERDITEELRMRGQLIHSERLSAVGQLVSGVAHELNNPLSVLTGHAALLKTASDPKVAERAVKMIHAAERCARIVRNFLTLARQRPPERTRVDLNQVVREALELVAYPLRVDNVELKLELSERLPRLVADGHQLHQVLVNLLTNAQQALRETPRRRRITVTTRSGPDDRSVVLEVADNGPGISQEIQARLFEPFFTTKPPGEGTGLGLAICQGIVNTHHGTLQVVSAPGEGATFRMELPREELEAAPAAEQEPESALAGKSILVVDDEPEIAALLAEMLISDGHQVETVEDGLMALEKLGAGTYDLVISDLRMPKLDGPGLHTEVARRHPRLLRRMVFVTGDTLGPESAEFLRRTEVATFGKPFALADVRRVIRQVLEGR